MSNKINKAFNLPSTSNEVNTNAFSSNDNYFIAPEKCKPKQIPFKMECINKFDLLCSIYTGETFSDYGIKTGDSGNVVLEKIIQNLNKDEEDIPTVTKTSQLVNDGENGTDKYITLNDIPPIPIFPSKLSEFENDENFITIEDIPDVYVPTQVSELENDAGYITSNDLPAPVDISGKANTGANNLTAANIISWRTALDIYSKGEINVLLNDVVYGPTFRDSIYQLETNKLNVPAPTPVTNTTEYPYIILGKANGNSTAKIAAGDVGKNVANSALTSVTGAKLTLGADWEINVGTGFYFGLKGLLDKSSDTTFNRMVVTDSSGRVAYTNGKNLIKGMPSLLTETERTAWKTEMNGGWTTASMSVGLISPPVMSKTLTTPTWVLLRGANLNLNPANFSIKIMSEDGLTEIVTIPNSQVQLQSSIEITFYYNMTLLSVGNYRIKINNGVAEYTTALTFNVSTSVEYIDFSGITWETKTYNNVPNPYAFGSQGSASYKTNPNVKPQLSENLIVCAQKSQEIIASNRDFYIEFNWTVGSWGTGGGNNSVFYWGLMPSTSNLELVNQASVYLRCQGRSDNPAKTVLVDLESDTLKYVHSGGATLTGTFAIIRRGSIFTLVGTSSAAIRINTKTNGTYGMSLYMANSNTLSAAESSMSVINAYYIN